MPFQKGHPSYARGGRPKGRKADTTLAREAGRAKALKLEEITAERTMRELAHVGFSRIGAVFDAHGNLQPVKTLPDHVQATVASVKTLKTNVVSGDGQQETTREVKLWDKMSALNTLAKHFGLVVEKVEHGLSDELLAKLDAIKGRNRGKA